MEATQHREIILAGSGGQGLILSGILLAEAAILEGRNVVQTQSYGIASRGGLSLAEVILDDDEIIFQQVQKPDCIVALTEEAVKKFEAWAASGVPIYYDITTALPREGGNFHGHPFTQLAGELGSVASLNILALGAVSAGTGIVRMESLEQLIRKRFRGKAVELNLKMLAAGAELALRGYWSKIDGEAGAGGESAAAGCSRDGSDHIERFGAEHPGKRVKDANRGGRKGAASSPKKKRFEVEVDPLVCKGCGYCRQVCNAGIFEQSDRFNPGGYLPSVVSGAERCTGCMRCLYICPDFCITVRES